MSDLTKNDVYQISVVATNAILKSLRTMVSARHPGLSEEALTKYVCLLAETVSCELEAVSVASGIVTDQTLRDNYIAERAAEIMDTVGTLTAENN